MSVVFLWFLIVFSSIIVISCDGLDSRTVVLAQGKVKGYKDPEYGIYIFNGIPYAKAPTGSDRFKAPLPPPTWTNIYDAVDKGIICPQRELMLPIPESKKMQEDCLIANVYVPDTEEKSLPVVVYVHGGVYILGWGDMMPTKTLVNTGKVIVVNFNYRLGAHGFLCFGTKDIPGNAGMKDQVALLRWVQKNIVSFGGNRNDVTIAGYSAGSSAVDLLMISKMTDGLFNKVIPESGANTAAFSVQLDPVRNAKEYAKLIQFEKFNDFNALEEFYKTVSYDRLMSGEVFNIPNSNFLVSPCVERDLGQERFLDASPVDILKSGNYKKMPMLYGFAEMEGLVRISNFDQWKDQMNEKFSDFLPADLKFKNEIEKAQVAQKVKRFYFDDKLVSEDTIQAYIDYFTDVIFAYSTLRSIKLQLEAGNDQIYLYEYSYVDDDAPLIPYTNKRGANHCAQSSAISDGLVMGTTLIAEKDLSENLKTHKKYIRNIWLNFIKTGTPVPEGSSLPKWPPVGENWSPHMSLNKTIQLKGSLLKDRTSFWQDIYDKYYFNPLPPSPFSEHTEL